MLIIRRLSCIDAASGIVSLSKWLSGAQVEREFSLNLCAEQALTEGFTQGFNLLRLMQAC